MRLYFTIFIICISRFQTFGQTAAFETNVTVDCAPLLVSFNNLSTGNIESYHWDFGNGMTSVEPNPMFVFDAPGLYEVTLSVNGGAHSVTRTITVHASGQVDFIYAQSCNLEVQFDLASSDHPPIAAFYWSFGDGITSEEMNPLHVYESNGSYEVVLDITYDNGCEATTVKTVTIDNASDVIIVPGKSNICTAEDVSFSVETSLNILSYSWTFSNGTFSTESNPLATFIDAGNYTVKLVAQTETCLIEKELIVEVSTCIEKQSQEISFRGPGKKTFGDSPFKLEAESTSGLPVVMSSSDNSVAIIRGGVLEIKGAGTTTISITQDGNEEYLPAQQKIYELQVSKAEQHLAWDLPSKLLLDEHVSLLALPVTSEQGLTVQYESSDNSVARVFGNEVVLEDTGAVNITARNEGDENHLPLELILEVNIQNVITSINEGKPRAIAYPNPGTGKFYLRQDTADFMLLDSYGKRIAAPFQKVKLDDDLFELDLRAYPNGIYLLFSGNEKAYRLIKK